MQSTTTTKATVAAYASPKLSASQYSALVAKLAIAQERAKLLEAK